MILSLVAFLLVQVPAQYCTCGPTYVWDTNLGQTSLQGDAVTLIDDPSNCPGTSGIRDLTTQSASLTPKKTYTLNTTVTTCDGQYYQKTAAWIDYNQNGVFDANEQLGDLSAAFGPITWSFVVPTDAKAGKTRLRVQTQETNATTLNPCANFSYGATKDFSIFINAYVYCKSGPTTTDDANMGGVTLVGETKNIRENSDCPGKIGPQDFTNLFADVRRGSTYQIAFNITTCGGSYDNLGGAWIDYDADGVLNSTDLIGYSPPQKGAASVVLTWTVPAGQFIGDTLLRVQVQETTATKMDPCSQFSYGATKDFTVSILPAQSDEEIKKISEKN